MISLTMVMLLVLVGTQNPMSPVTEEEYGQAFYRIAADIKLLPLPQVTGKRGVNKHYRPSFAHKNSVYRNGLRIHLVRVPKAGSSAWSAITRRLAGCSGPQGIPLSESQNQLSFLN